ncbi:hypothetical protein SMATCC274_11890 [Serratia marcescens]|nr:hypothetical protein SMATCC274_11890 [Serratia marcescens]
MLGYPVEMRALRRPAGSAPDMAPNYGKCRRFAPVPMILDIKPASSGFVAAPGTAAMPLHRDVTAG